MNRKIFIHIFLLAAILSTGFFLNFKETKAAVGTVTVELENSAQITGGVPLGGTARFTGAIPTGATATSITNVSFSVASDGTTGMPAFTIAVNPSDSTYGSQVFKKFTSAGCATGHIPLAP